MFKHTILSIALAIAATASAATYSAVPLDRVLAEIQREANGEILVNFAPADLSRFTVTCTTDGLTPLEAIRAAVGRYPVKVDISGRYVTIQSYPNRAHGRIIDRDGEAVEYAAVSCSPVGAGATVKTITDENGRWSIDLPLTGSYQLTATCVGFNPASATIRAGRVPEIVMEKTPLKLPGLNVNESKQINLGEVVVSGRAVRNLRRPTVGVTTIDADRLLRVPVMMGEPDVIKTLQMQPGVSQGVEAFTGLYVHGGENDQNLFLYDGLPLYHVSHLAGMFSAFNAATINTLDFYKSAFPAQYGGNVSSVTDMRSHTPDFRSYHGRLSLGLISGNAYLTGPIVRERTAFAVGVRRTWLDAVTIPALAIINATKKKEGHKTIGGYAFTDVNLRIDHRFSPRTSARLVGYYGHDRFKLGSRDFQTPENQFEYFDESTNRMHWGNIGALIGLTHNVGRTRLGVEAYTTNYSSYFAQLHSWQADKADPLTYGYNNASTANAIHDLGVRLASRSHIADFWTLHAGTQYVHHRYMPERVVYDVLDDNAEEHLHGNEWRVAAHELSVYADNSLSPCDRLEINLGARYSLYHAATATHNSVEPRASLRLQLGQNLSVKAAYAEMVQYAQQIANNFVSLPTDLWQPTAAYFKPLRSRQVSAGVYGNLPQNIYYSVEGWYKHMSNLVEYREGVSGINPRLDWQQKLTSGCGWAYGMDISVTRHAGRVTGSIGYGLMWNWRRFDALNGGMKYPAKFDNRHKINIDATVRITAAIDIAASWVYTTGNRITLPLYDYQLDTEVFPWAPGYGSHAPHEVIITGNTGMGLDYFSGVNNIRIPAYHRLDLSVNFHKKLKRGRSSVWAVSLYNAYSRINPITIKKDMTIEKTGPDQWTSYYRFRTLGLFPIIPSVSYTYIF